MNKVLFSLLLLYGNSLHADSSVMERQLQKLRNIVASDCAEPRCHVAGCYEQEQRQTVDKQRQILLPGLEDGLPDPISRPVPNQLAAIQCRIAYEETLEAVMPALSKRWRQQINDGKIKINIATVAMPAKPALPVPSLAKPVAPESTAMSKFLRYFIPVTAFLCVLCLIFLATYLLMQLRHRQKMEQLRFAQKITKPSPKLSEDQINEQIKEIQKRASDPELRAIWIACYFRKGLEHELLQLEKHFGPELFDITTQDHVLQESLRRLVEKSSQIEYLSPQEVLTRAQQLLRQAELTKRFPSPEDGLSTLAMMSTSEILQFIKSVDDPEVISCVLTQVDKEIRTNLAKELSEKQIQSVFTSKITTEVIERAAHALQNHLKSAKGTQSRHLDIAKWEELFVGRKRDQIKSLVTVLLRSHPEVISQLVLPDALCQLPAEVYKALALNFQPADWAQALSLVDAEKQTLILESFPHQIAKLIRLQLKRLDEPACIIPQALREGIRSEALAGRLDLSRINQQYC